MTSWLTSAIQTVRDKSTDALDFVRRDLTEFTTTVKSDTEVYINKIKTQEVGDLGINRFVSKLSDSIKAHNENEMHFPSTASFDRVQTELTRLQNDESTYLIDPTPIESYENWRRTNDFNVDTRKGDIAQILIDAPHVRSFYAHLVPAQTTHSDFWSRYYYRIHQIEEEEARRTQLLRRAHEICSENNENTEQNNGNDWDEPEEEWSQGPVNIAQELKSEPVSVEHHEEELRSAPGPIEDHEEEEEEPKSEPIVVEHHEEESKSEPIIVEHHEEESKSEPDSVEHHEEEEEESKSELDSVEHHEEEEPKSEPASIEDHEAKEQQESIPVNTILEKANSEHAESDTVSGDSWEREFDETDISSSKSNVDPLTKSEETITSESLSSSTTAAAAVPLVESSSSVSTKKPENEFDDEWESWS